MTVQIVKRDDKYLLKLDNKEYGVYNIPEDAAKVATTELYNNLLNSIEE